MSELREKIQRALSGPQLAVLATVTAEGLPWARYVMAFADDDLTLRIVTALDSRKAQQIGMHPDVHLTCGATTLEATREYLQIAGRAEITRDAQKRQAMWNEMLERYFSGPDDPNYAIIRVRPVRIEYMGSGSMEPEVWTP
ncbi:MAG: hypothetical protein GF330_04465 [Candidatus Eisenbacteria bacterium]|nr:hypothetical protein [Candidatus Eisenbacteria bacterium]